MWSMALLLKHGLYVADVLFSWIIVYPLVILYWRGTFDLWTHYVNVDCTGQLNTSGSRDPDWDPAHNQFGDCVEVHGLWLSAFVGGTICIIINIFNPFLQRKISREQLPVVPYTVITKLYLYILGFASTGYWRGAWALFDHYGDSKLGSNALGLGASLLVAWLCRLSNAAQAPPWISGSEIKGNLFEASTWLNRKSDKDGWWLWSMDIALTQVVAQSIPIFIWRCMWNILSELMLPYDPDLSSGVMLAAGHGGLLLLVFVQFPVAHLSTKLDSRHILWKIILEDAWFVLVNGFVVLSMWGCWNLVANHVLPDPVVGGWTCHVVGFVLLTVLCQTDAMLGNWVTLDGESDCGEGVKCNVDYFQYIFRVQIITQEIRHGNCVTLENDAVDNIQYTAEAKITKENSGDTENGNVI